ncbi:MAG: sigma 54-interacting transcriptional regulator, partial [Tannerella sp.]|nr:sigma 54-interacting transcriptional regulator [Tannerella sp.]
PETLFESELFGYVKGAFTDARTDKAGRMEIASGGTLFLNEIGNLSLQMQAKLLTAIEKKEITRLGSTRMQPVDVRFICATNLDIYEAVARGDFRQDLLYRINTLEIRIPPLRERGDDIILLANWFLNRYANHYKKNISGLTPEAKKKLLKYPFPGNVRELQNIIERAVILSNDAILKASSITMPSYSGSSEQRRNTETLNLDILEREAIDKALRRTGGNLAKAAELLGITRYALYRKIK